MTKQKKIIIFISFLFSLHIANAVSQNTTISGYVRDINTYRVISNVNILVKNTKVGATSNFGGKYRLQVRGVPKDASIVFQHICFQ